MEINMTSNRTKSILCWLLLLAGLWMAIALAERDFTIKKASPQGKAFLFRED